jgi:hypothetical protein
VRFEGGTSGHADGDNAGFQRSNAVLAVLVLTDEEDCSASDPELFDLASTRFSPEPNLRCSEHPEALHPVGRYVDGLLAVESAGLAFGLVAGVPPDLTVVGGGTRFDAILSDPRMQEEIDPAMPNRLTPSCDVPGRGFAFAPRRMVEVARGLDAAGATATVQSICLSDLTSAIDTFLGQLGTAGYACP